MSGAMGSVRALLLGLGAAFSLQSAAEAADTGLWQHAALLRTADDQARAFCSGVVIAANRVLTAKHCLNGIDGLKFTLEFGVDGRFTTHAVQPTKVIPFAGDGRLFPLFDVAVVEFVGSLPEGVSPAVFYQDTAPPRLDATLRIFGFGQKGEAQEGQVAYLGSVNGDRVAALGVARTPATGGPCFGDSGGGVYAFNQGRWTLFGIVGGSWDALNGGLRRCTDSLMVLTEVRPYAEWLARASEPPRLPPAWPKGRPPRPYDRALQDFTALCLQEDFTSEAWVTVQQLIARVAAWPANAPLMQDQLLAATPFVSCQLAATRLDAFTSGGGTINLTGVRNLAPLSRLPRLARLVLSDTDVLDWAPLKRLPRLTSLSIIGQQHPVAAQVLLSLPWRALSLQYVTITGGADEILRLRRRAGVSFHQVTFAGPMRRE